MDPGFAAATRKYESGPLVIDLCDDMFLMVALLVLFRKATVFRRAAVLFPLLVQVIGLLLMVARYFLLIGIDVK